MLSLHIICFCTLDCYVGKGLTYQGHISKTENDRECQFWTDFEPHSHEYNNANAFPDETMADAANYCRNQMATQAHGVTRQIQMFDTSIV